MRVLINLFLSYTRNTLLAEILINTVDFVKTVCVEFMRHATVNIMKSVLHMCGMDESSVLGAL